MTYNFLCVINSPWQVEILNKMARIYDHDELIEMRYITLGKRQYLPILKCIIRPILNRSITAIDQQLLDCNSHQYISVFLVLFIVLLQELICSQNFAPPSCT